MAMPCHNLASQPLHSPPGSLVLFPRNPGEHEYANIMAAPWQQDASMNHNHAQQQCTVHAAYVAVVSVTTKHKHA